MCVIEHKTFVFSNNRQEVKTYRLPCSRAKGDKLCDLVTERSIEARVVERRPSVSSSSRRQSRTDDTMAGAGNNDRARQIRPILRQPSKRVSFGQPSSPVDIPESSTSARPQPRVETRAPSNAPRSPREASPLPRHVTPSASSSTAPRMTFSQDGTAIYDRPPSLEMPRAAFNERSHRRTTSSSNPATGNFSSPAVSTPSSEEALFVDSTGTSPSASHSRQDSASGQEPSEEQRKRDRLRAALDRDDREAYIRATGAALEGKLPAQSTSTTHDDRRRRRRPEDPAYRRAVETELAAHARERDRDTADPRRIVTRKTYTVSSPASPGRRSSTTAPSTATNPLVTSIRRTVTLHQSPTAGPSSPTTTTKTTTTTNTTEPLSAAERLERLEQLDREAQQTRQRPAGPRGSTGVIALEIAKMDEAMARVRLEERAEAEAAEAAKARFDRDSEALRARRRREEREREREARLRREGYHP